MPRSLAARFVFASVLILPILLGTSAYMLDLAFRRSLLVGEEEQLKTQIYLLLGAAEFDNDVLIMPEVFQEPRLNQLDSGLYGWIGTNNAEEMWRSPSARVLEFAATDFDTGSIDPGSSDFTTINSNAGILFAYFYDISWQIDDDSERLLRVATLHDQETFNAEISGYRRQLWRWLGLLTVLIIVAQTIILRWGLRPLQILAKDIKAIESGDKKALDSEYPKELQSVTYNFNQVLHSEKKQRERYRNTLNDLAHSLKTPLAVIQGCVNQNEHKIDGETIGDQVQRMNQIVSHQLSRAVHSHTGMPGQMVAVEPLVRRLIDSLNKVYREKNHTIEVNIAKNCAFAGDERDFMELLGNVLDNAYKYGASWIAVGAQQDAAALTLTVADDGQGIAKRDRQTILQRGARADTATPGHGIGLAVALDIISSYEGSLTVEESLKGGALFIISLPPNK